MPKNKNKILLSQFVRIVSDKYDKDYLIQEIQDVIEMVFATLEELVVQGHTIEIRGYGNFEPKYGRTGKFYSRIKNQEYTINPGVKMVYKSSEDADERTKKKARENKPKAD